jgi:hypothetical protein
MEQPFGYRLGQRPYRFSDQNVADVEDDGGAL